MVTFDFAGKIVIVTGINREIGASIAVAFANAGARVVGVYYGEYDRVAPIVAANPHIDAIAADVGVITCTISPNNQVIA
jgi:NAD(P)-dependent dehydrogenase (short-subunit alcohol dehydrogenase family)